MQIGVEDCVLFHAFLLVLFAQRNDLLEDLGIEALYPCTICMFHTAFMLVFWAFLFVATCSDRVSSPLQCTPHNLQQQGRKDTLRLALASPHFR